MRMSLSSTARCLAFATLAGIAPAQGESVTPPPAAKAALKQEPHHLVRRYPQDKDVAIATVGSRTLTLGDLIDHLDKRHSPGIKVAIEKRPEIQAFLQSDLIAPWARHFADLEALRQTFGEGIDEAKLEQAQSDALKASFQGWLEADAQTRQNNNRPPISEAQINSRLSDFQLRSGLAAELQGMLDYLEPGEYSRAQLQQFFNDNARYFGGQVNIAHILVQNRDAGTGILLNDEGMGRANTRLADIKARLRPDGSNFEEVALRSDDQKTGKDGGRLSGVRRFDDRLPAALCRAAWNLRDGELSDVVESQYGWHIVKRIDFTQQVFFLFTDAAIPEITRTMRRARQEERLFAARKLANVNMLL